jgi:alpha-ketoglutarate-dependent taurine dioxygenase
MGHTLRELTPAFGAEVIGFDPLAPLDEETTSQLRGALDERGILLFRRVGLDAAQQTSLVRMLARDDLSLALDVRLEHFVSNREENGGAPYGRLPFHSDMMWADEPFRVLSLYAVQAERPVVPTVFASATQAWSTLPDELRARVEGLHALHMTGQQMRDDDGRLLQLDRENNQMTTTSVGHRHPVTGDTMLYVCQMTTREIVELSPDESASLLDELFAHLYRASALWQQDWEEGDLLVWDNLAIQHARGNVEIDGPARTLRKVMSYSPFIAGAERPRYDVAR